MQDRFSKRHGHIPTDRKIEVREAAPVALREAILQIALAEGALTPGRIRSALCAVFRRSPDPNNWSPGNVERECDYLLSDAPWYRVYDAIEAIYDVLTHESLDQAEAFAEATNECLLENGIGWKLERGRIEARGEEHFEAAVAAATESLEQAGLRTASLEIREARLDLSKRPKPDLTGAIHHAMAAAECTAREIAGDRSATLGQILKRKAGLLPKPLDEAVSKVWGYASEEARHVSEESSPTWEEAELVVSLSAAVSTYLARKFREAEPSPEEPHPF